MVQPTLSVNRLMKEGIFNLIPVNKSPITPVGGVPQSGWIYITITMVAKQKIYQKTKFEWLFQPDIMHLDQGNWQENTVQNH